MNTIKFLFAIGVLIMASLCMPKAYGGTITTLTYIGPDYNITLGPNAYNASENVSGTISFVGTLGANLPNALITPSTFSFFDGIQTFTNTGTYSAETFNFTTDATGQITAWKINIAEGSSGIPNIYTSYLPSYLNGTTIDDGQLSPMVYGEYFGNSKGFWTVTTSSVSEPSSVVLLFISFGFVGLIALLRRKPAVSLLL